MTIWYVYAVAVAVVMKQMSIFYANTHTPKIYVYIFESICERCEVRSTLSTKPDHNMLHKHKCLHDAALPFCSTGMREESCEEI
jgi:hypothetical protein